MSFAAGSLVRARGREWVVQPDSDGDLLILRPLGGSDEEVAGVYFFQDLMAKRSLASLYDFQSGPGLFAKIGHARFKFSLVTLAGAGWRVRQPEFAFFLRDVAHLDRPDRRFGLTAEDNACSD